jgi:hypothetical protein
VKDRTPWTPAEDAALIEAAGRLGCWQTLADTLGRSQGATRGRAHRLGVRLNEAAVLKHRSAAAKAVFARPGQRQKVAASVSRAWTPDRREEARQRALATNSIARALATPFDETARIAAIHEYWRRWRSWCPAYLWQVYCDLKDQKLMPAADARRIVLDDFANDLRRALRAIAAIGVAEARKEREAKARSRNDFDAIMARVSAGQSRLTERAVLSTRDHDFSLIGSTLA